MELQKNKLLLGLSGGVDSATAALLLKEKGYDVTGFYFDVMGGNEKGRAEAEAVASQIGIPLIYEDVSTDFRGIVIENFVTEYLRGRTPNPCIICNPNIKFRRLLRHADEIGAYYIATGHYCRILHDEANSAYYIRRAANDTKDPSYMLYRLGQDVLSRLSFPLGEFLSKEETREIARDSHLSNAEKKDSQEICFIDPADNYVNYIMTAGHTSAPGNFVDRDGKILGRHSGILHYTIGQRKGLGIALGKPTFVTEIRCAQNEIVLGDNEDLFACEVTSADNVFADGDSSAYDGKKVLAKVRYSAPPSEAIIRIDGDRIKTVFEKPQRAITPGQSVVFYDEEKLLGGGFIV